MRDIKSSHLGQRPTIYARGQYGLLSDFYFIVRRQASEFHHKFYIRRSFMDVFQNGTALSKKSVVSVPSVTESSLEL